MALITRFTRLFRADIHAVLDRIEEPDVLLAQSIREMEEDIARDEQRMRILQNERRQIADRRDETERAMDELHDELDVCFSSGKQDLARVVIRRKLEADQLKRTLAQKHKSLADSLADLEDRLGENRERLSVMKQRAALLSGDDTAAQRDPPWAPGPAVVSDEDVEVAFLREQHLRQAS